MVFAGLEMNSARAKLKHREDSNRAVRVRTVQPSGERIKVLVKLSVRPSVETRSHLAVRLALVAESNRKLGLESDHLHFLFVPCIFPPSGVDGDSRLWAAEGVAQRQISHVAS